MSSSTIRRAVRLRRTRRRHPVRGHRRTRHLQNPQRRSRPGGAGDDQAPRCLPLAWRAGGWRGRHPPDHRRARRQAAGHSRHQRHRGAGPAGTDRRQPHHPLCHQDAAAQQAGRLRQQRHRRSDQGARDGRAGRGLREQEGQLRRPVPRLSRPPRDTGADRRHLPRRGARRSGEPRPREPVRQRVRPAAEHREPDAHGAGPRDRRRANTWPRFGR